MHLQGGRDGVGGKPFQADELGTSAHMGATRNPEKEEWTYSEE